MLPLALPAQPPLDRDPRRAPVRVVVAEDSPLFRKGLVHVLAGNGFDVVAEVGDANALADAVDELLPDLAVVDVRMPPSKTDEGARAAVELRDRHPELAVLLLSQVVEARHALLLLTEEPEGFGYLLKDRVGDINEFIQSVNRVAKGGTAIDPEVVGELLGRRRRARDPLDELTRREREVLELMAQGCSNHGICEAFYLAPKTVESHVHSILTKLAIPTAPDGHRRVLAVLTYLRA